MARKKHLTKGGLPGRLHTQAPCDCRMGGGDVSQKQQGMWRKRFWCFHNGLQLDFLQLPERSVWPR